MQTIYFDMTTGTMGTIEPDVDKIIEGSFPEGVDALQAGLILSQILQQLQLRQRGLELPSVAYKINVGSD